ncbi:unnamed protein product [Penicillium nalgiovense]|nr:unnamed protein product [Penicillium nalgiovense]
MLSRATTGLFHRYFRRLEQERHFIKDSIPDQVSLLAVYMPNIRQRVISWTQN